MISTTEPELVNFFIFNPRYGQCEGEEHQKILFYYPAETDKDIQLKNAGLCEALIKFTETFNPDKPCQNFHTQKAKQFLYEAEKDFWLVMTIGIPRSKEKTEGENTCEENSDLIKENVFEAVLRKSYRYYQLFSGTFTSMLESNINDGISILKQKIGNFFNSYLLNLKLANCDILDVFQGISFLPLGKEPFLHILSFINMIEAKFKCIKYCTFLYNDQLIWSGINSDDMQIIYSYLVSTLLPSYVDIDLQVGSMPAGSTSSVYKHGTFVTKGSITRDSKSVVEKVPKVYLTNNGETSEIVYMVVYRILSATLCLFISDRDKLTTDFFATLDANLGPYITSIVTEVSEHCIRHKLGSSTNYSGSKLLYFNKLNLAQKSTMHTQRNINTTVSGDLLRMIADLNAEKTETDICGEVMYLTLNDCWLIGRYSNSREFYVIFTQKKGNLIEVTEDVKKLCNSELKGIFFTE
ncbi:hypothetical protein RUM43_006008 [Polyplax serrata]|uniref:CCZ1/INTU/HSP4 first Longin domain-containing protein n=1 Tax=Polyplax serrata TaxID=468196 RepID=A0AAN8PEA6_POLSC